MKAWSARQEEFRLPGLAQMPLPVKALITATLIAFGIAMLGALGQIIVHDIIPTFYEPRDSAENQHHTHTAAPDSADRGHGDLLGEGTVIAKTTPAEPFYKSDQFVWMLKWTHIHLFGMNMIFILMGPITLLLNLSPNLKTWLIVLPFAGVLIDIAAMWLKGYLSPMFFWLHIPGGVMFGAIFVFIALRAFQEMWFSS
ncbi:MAG: hypothetical protein C4519_12805 [Desulfobacteraceae bacterium]|nr:MAG: hypothetical protein C4519_12805 [Desulfobacteraceae bacterium]